MNILKRIKLGLMRKVLAMENRIYMNAPPTQAYLKSKEILENEIKKLEREK